MQSILCIVPGQGNKPQNEIKAQLTNREQKRCQLLTKQVVSARLVGAVCAGFVQLFLLLPAIASLDWLGTRPGPFAEWNEEKGREKMEISRKH